MIKQDEVYAIGRIGKPHGIRGELSFMFDDDIFDRTDADYLVIETDGILVPFFIEEYRFRSDTTAILKLEGIDTQQRARELTNCRVFFPRAVAEEASDGSLSWPQLCGFGIYDDATGREIGTISAVDDSTENVLFNVQTPDGRHVLIPAADEFIVHFDQKRQRITMTLPEGLLEL